MCSLQAAPVAKMLQESRGNSKMMFEALVEAKGGKIRKKIFHPTISIKTKILVIVSKRASALCRTGT